MHSYIRDHRADSIGQAINTLKHEDAQARRDEQARNRHNQLVAEQRRARASAEANANIVSWSTRNR